MKFSLEEIWQQRGILPENPLNTIPYFPVYGLRMSIYGSNLSQYGKIRDRIQAFFAQWEHLRRENFRAYDFVT